MAGLAWLLVIISLLSWSDTEGSPHETRRFTVARDDELQSWLLKDGRLCVHILDENPWIILQQPFSFNDSRLIALQKPSSARNTNCDSSFLLLHVSQFRLMKEQVRKRITTAKRINFHHRITAALELKEDSKDFKRIIGFLTRYNARLQSKRMNGQLLFETIFHRISKRGTLLDDPNYRSTCFPHEVRYHCVESVTNNMDQYQVQQRFDLARNCHRIITSDDKGMLREITECQSHRSKGEFQMSCCYPCCKRHPAPHWHPAVNIVNAVPTLCRFAFDNFNGLDFRVPNLKTCV